MHLKHVLNTDSAQRVNCMYVLGILQMCFLVILMRCPHFGGFLYESYMQLFYILIRSYFWKLLSCLVWWYALVWIIGCQELFYGMQVTHTDSFVSKMRVRIYLSYTLIIVPSVECIYNLKSTTVQWLLFWLEYTSIFLAFTGIPPLEFYPFCS